MFYRLIENGDIEIVRTLHERMDTAHPNSGKRRKSSSLEFTHNVLNLPMSVRERDASGQHMTGDITYTYLGDGTKVSARVGSQATLDWEAGRPQRDSTGLIAPPFPGRPTFPGGSVVG